ncbi:class I adenylate-forming enzyme family protein [Saccharothrix algeriensis]|uniref:AMP-binding protein n=1 Tax=Saccharothrix algeriensis TaxID=173560 RepID=A0A8T8I1C0_9PSEU|nr:AMP-binding protein [Saccharothrix algeriensis]MBM7810308.1 acyl-CoA synthetase (AMP-forming)/AMP-acid ligase II [Saccharothrix algeriensis]QTR04461.1 AMP-binding protein [Saccharothrix algeriensis]
MWLTRVLRGRLALSPDAVALVDEGGELTWREFAARVAARRAFLEGATDRLDRVAYLAHGRKEHFELLFACAGAGRTFVPMNPSLTAPELAHQLALVEPAVLVAEPDLVGFATGAVGDAPVAVVPLDDARSDTGAGDGAASDPLTDDEAAVVFFTSATTGRSKGVEVAERSLMANALAWALDVLPAHGPARFLSACPLFHGSSVIALDYLVAGRPVHVLPRFAPRPFSAAVRKWGITQTFLVPTMVELLLRTPHLDTTQFESLELIGHGAAPMPPELARRCREALGVELHSVYGITEGGGPAIGGPLPRAAEAPAAGATPIGVPMSGVRARVVAEDGRPAAVGEPGELRLRWPGLMTGYWRDPGATAAAVDDDGWLRTQDVVLVDGSGLHWILDRRTDLILRGGQNVYPAEVESVLRGLPGVAEAAVVGAASQLWGQTPVAFVTLEPGADVTPAQITQWCASRLASYKLPSEIVVVEQIPVSPSGKVLRRELRARVEHQRHR